MDETTKLLSEASEAKSRFRKHYTGAGIGVGIPLGVALGAAFDQVGLGVALGTAIGAAIDGVSHWRNKDTKRRDD